MEKANAPLLLLGAGLLMAVLVIGHEVNGSKRWIRYGLVMFKYPRWQSYSSFAIWLVTWCEKIRSTGFRRGFLKPLTVLGVYVLLILKQPDKHRGMMFVTTTALLFLAGARLTQFLP